MKQTFAAWLTEELKRRDMSQADLARASGNTCAHVSRIINDKGGLGANSIVRIATGLQLPVEFVLEKAGLIPPSGLSEVKLELIGFVRNMSDEDAKALAELVRPLPRRSLATF